MTNKEQIAMEMGRESLQYAMGRLRYHMEMRGWTPAESFAECESIRVSLAEMGKVLEGEKEQK